MQREVDDFLASHPYAETTKEQYRYILSLLLDQPYGDWSASDLLQFVERSNWGSSMQYVALCACKAFIRWRFGALHPALLARKKRTKPKRQRSLEPERILQLLASFDPFTARGARDLAIAALAIDTGLRASEIPRIQLADVDLEHRTLQVVVKGGQWGMAIYSAETAAFIERWLSFRVPADGVGALFVSLRDSKDRGRPLTKYGIKAMFRKWGRDLGFQLSPHDARRTFGNVSTSFGAPQSVAMAAGRWESDEAFRRYTQDVVARMITPYLPIANVLKDKAES